MKNEYLIQTFFSTLVQEVEKTIQEDYPGVHHSMRQRLTESRLLATATRLAREQQVEEHSIHGGMARQTEPGLHEQSR
jgi:hypothetical protein